MVQHPTGGVIKEIHARDGDKVAAGDVLIELDGEDLRPELGTVEGQWFEMLARKSRLHAERDGLDAITFDPELTSRAATSPEIATLIAAQEQQFAARRKSQQARRRRSSRSSRRRSATRTRGWWRCRPRPGRRSTLLSREIDGQQTLLDQGLTEVTRVLTPQRELARLEGVDGPGRGLIAENRGKIAEIEIQRVRLVSKAREDAIAELRELEFQEIETREKRRQILDRMARLYLRAPVSGTVYGSTADTVRAVIRAGRAGDVRRAAGHAADRAHPHRHHPHRPGARGPGGDPALLGLRPAHHAGAHAGT